MKRKQIIAIILAILSVALMCAPLISFAQVRTGEGEATLLQEGDFDIETGKSVHFGATASTADTVALNIYNGLMNYSDEIDVSSLRCSTEDFDAFYSNVINDNPDLFFVSSSYQYYYNKYTKTVTSVIPQYAMTQSEVTAALEIFNIGVSRALKEVDSSMSDLQKALTIHDYICAYAIYPQIYDENGNYVAAWDLDIYHSAYGFFKDYNAVCAGYTLTFSYLMKQLDIECEYVSSNAMEHAWNKIKLDGNWYNIDITYDNADFVDGENTYGLAYHSCFLKSDSYFQSENSLYHHSYYTYDDCTANATTYDDYFWNDVNSRIYAVNGDFYYLDPDYTNQRVYLTKRTPSGTESKVNATALQAPTLTITRYAFDSSGAQHNIAHKEILSRLLYLDGKFYATDFSSLYCIKLNGTRATLLSGIGYTISLGSVDGNIVYQTYNDKSTVITVDKSAYFRENLGGDHFYPDCNNDGIVNGRDWGYIINP